MPRPAYSTTNTATTVYSATSCATDSESTAYNSTALTTPDLNSPPTKRKPGQMSRLEPMLEIFEGRQKAGDEEDYLSRNRSRSPAPGIKMEERYMDSPRGLAPTSTTDISRGPSVRDRAKEFEGIARSPTPASLLLSRPLPSPQQTQTQPRGSSSTTTPLKINKANSNLTSNPRSTKRVPVPATPQAEYSTPPVRSSERSPSEATRRGSTRKMIQQWETGPSIPLEPPKLASPVARRVISRDYLDQKPLPVPNHTPAASSTPLRNTMSNTSTMTYHQSPSRSQYAPSPLNQYHLQTPDAGPSRKRGGDLSPSGSAYSLSPSGEKRRKGKSPLKDMLNIFGGGIQAIGRKARGKGKGLSTYGSKDSLASKNSVPWSDPMDRLGTNGLPGGIVFSDRMGDKEMMRRGSDPAVIRGSAIMYLTATPCSSVSSWGSWLTSWAMLTPHDLKVTYCPIFQDPKSGHTTPKRILSGTGFFQGSSTPAVAFSSIPPPDVGSPPDVELDMTQCVEVRSLRKEEVKGRGIPPVPEGVGTEVLEMVWRDGSKRYIGVEGVGGRLGWVSAIWDVLLAYKPEQTRDLPPPSPTIQSRHPSRAQTASLASFPFPDPAEAAHSSLSDFEHRIKSMEASSAPPVQKVGDTWVTAGTLGRGSMSDINTGPTGLGLGSPPGNDLRDSVQRMFDTGPDTPISVPMSGPSRSDSEATARIKAWQPATERELSIFSRSGTGRSQASASPMSVRRNIEPESEGNSYAKADTVLSFDPNDLNPSRSASQVRRTSTLLGGNVAARTRGGALTVVDERSDDGLTEAMRANTHISHVTFPKPSIDHGTTGPDRSLTPIQSVGYSSTESEVPTMMATPHTARSTITALSSIDQTVLGHMESHTSEHGRLSKQVDNVQIDLRAAISSLSALLAQSKVLSDPTLAPVPKALDDRLTSLGLDIKGMENAIQLSSLAASRQPIDTTLPEIHGKLDSIAKACEEILAKHQSATQPLSTSIVPGTILSDKDSATLHGLAGAGVKRPPMPEKRGTLGLTSDPEAEKMAGEEVAQIMAQLTGGSIHTNSKASPRLGGLQVLHSSAPNSPKLPGPGSPDEVTKQVGEVLGLVKELKDARVIQTQQTTDMARYLNELNAWLEKFVANSSKEITDMSTRLKTLVGEPATEERASIPGLPDLVADVHSMMSEQKRRNDEEGMMGQRVDNLLKMMGDERDRMAGQQSTIEHVLSVIENHRSANENVLRSLAIDLTNEIRGERIRFVEAMQQATTVNVNFHIEEFKKVLATEVNKAMGELGHVRAEKQALEQQISDLFALKAKHAPGSSRKNTRKGAVPPMSPQMGQGQMPGQMQMQPSPGMAGRILPAPPR